MMQKLLSPFAETTYAVLRIVSGLLWSFHGMHKLFWGSLLPYPQPETWSQLWFGGIIEFTCGLLMAFGFLTSPAAFLASGTMAVAYLQFHASFHFDKTFFPLVNGGEQALAYAFLFLFIACKGAGKWSVDARCQKKAEQAAT